MRFSLHKTIAVLGVILLFVLTISLGAILQWGKPSGSALPEWEMQWIPGEAVVSPEDYNEEGEWMPIRSNSAALETPKGVTAAWARLTLPEVQENSAILIENVFGQEIKAYSNHELIYSAQNPDRFKGLKAIIPLSKEQSREQLYVWSSGSVGQLGIEGRILSGDYRNLLPLYVKQDVMDLFIGASFMFTALVFAICTILLKKEQFFSGFLLVLVILSSGVFIITQSPVLPLLFSSSGRAVDLLFELALLTLLGSSILFYEKMVVSGNKFVARVRAGMVGYTAIYFCLMILNFFFSYRLDIVFQYAKNLTITLLVLQLLFLFVSGALYAFRGHANAIILSAGFTALISASFADLFMYFLSDGSYHFYWWKWGVAVLLLSLIVMLGRGYIKSHDQIVQYSYEQEKFNDDLQKSEKMEIISDLAASVAHEVQNPLHVTRGLLQILGERSGQKEMEYLQLAVTELDRASLIITDFLTFAKPEIELPERIDVSGEMKRIAGMVAPLANLREAEIILSVQDELHTEGSSSKLKQAFLNILKNSVEALQANGLITITAWQSDSYIIVSVRDNGEGMKSSELARLGEPYYSNKSKGTGLGLMVTFRIIQAMGGTIKFHSQLGEGTEVIVKLPAARVEEKEVLACV